MHKDVLVIVCGQQININDDVIIKKSKGSYYLKNNKEYIRYIESDDNGDITNVILKIDNDKIKIIKKGAINTIMDFCIEEYMQVQYSTKLIDVLFDLYTYKTSIIRNNNEINIEIEYDLIADNEKLSSNIININIIKSS